MTVDKDNDRRYRRCSKRKSSVTAMQCQTTYHESHFFASTSLSLFLNRHPTITDLILGELAPPQQLDDIHFPNLKFYNGSGFFIPFLTVDSIRSVTSVCLVSYPRDVDVETVLMHLAPMCLLRTLTFCSIGYDTRESALLGSVARSIPHIRTLTLRKVNANAAQPSPADILQIAACLEKLQLSALSIRHIHGTDDGTEDEDRKTITLWGGACKTLASIVLHQRLWTRTKGHWSNTTLPAELA
ncbi:hypothetical protein C8R45DRAFT_938496 [Mycena sanguinolenta]|nr:hypothetical protein C8R45DRAFT_938496 [Mycena sanguinolenta]